MAEYSNLFDIRDGTAGSDGRRIPVAWAKAEALQTRLRRNGIRTTIHFDTPAREAWLEVWPGMDCGQVEKLVGECKGKVLV